MITGHDGDGGDDDDDDDADDAHADDDDAHLRAACYPTATCESSSIWFVIALLYFFFTVIFNRQNDAHHERMSTYSAAAAATVLAGGRLNGRNPMLQRPRERTLVDRRTRLHIDLLQEPEERPVLHQANSKPLSDSRGEGTTGALSSTSCIASRSAKGFAHCKLSGPRSGV